MNLSLPAKAIKVGAGFGWCEAIDTDGKVWIWDKSGQAKVLDGIQNAVDIQSATVSTWILCKDGTLWYWQLPGNPPQKVFDNVMLPK